MTPTKSMEWLRDLAAVAPGIPLSVALASLDEQTPNMAGCPYTGSFFDVEAMAEYAQQQPQIMCYLESHATAKKINAIKEMRAATSCGLKEAKDAIEYLCAKVLGWPTYSSF